MGDRMRSECFAKIRGHLLHTRIARIRNLAHKAVYAAPEVVTKPSQLLSTLKGAHWATLNLIDQPWLRNMGIDTVLDVGANTGQFASACRVVFPDATLYSFEPIPECYQALNLKMGRDSRFTAFNAAIGSENGQATLHRMSFSESSSLMEPAPLLKSAFPWAESTSEIIVDLRTLDSYLPELELGAKILLKIDVQGYEESVLLGAPKVLSHASVVIAEVSFVPLYGDKATFGTIYGLMTEMGFEFSGLMDQLLHPETAQILEGDALFLSRGDASREG